MIKIKNIDIKASVDYKYYLKVLLLWLLETILIYLILLKLVGNLVSVYIFCLIFLSIFAIYGLFRIFKILRLKNDYIFIKLVLDENKSTIIKDRVEFISRDILIDGELTTIKTKGIFLNSKYSYIWPRLKDFSGKEVTVGYNTRTKEVIVFKEKV